MSARLTILAAAAIAVVVLLAGCGGGDDSTSTSPATEASAATGARAEPDSDASQGSGSSGEQADVRSIATSPLGREAYVKKASAACARESRQASQEVETYADKISRSEELPEPVLLARIVKDVLVPSYEAEIDDIYKLGAPAGDEKKIEAMLVAQQAAVDESRQLETVKFPEEFEKYFTKVSRELEAYGFKSCLHG